MQIAEPHPREIQIPKAWGEAQDADAASLGITPEELLPSSNPVRIR